MKLNGVGGCLLVGGRAAATLGEWRGYGELMDFTAEAKVEEVNEFWFERGKEAGYSLVLQWGEREMRRECPSATFDDRGRLHFHARRGERR